MSFATCSDMSLSTVTTRPFGFEYLSVIFFYLRSSWWHNLTALHAFPPSLVRDTSFLLTLNLFLYRSYLFFLPFELVRQSLVIWLYLPELKYRMLFLLHCPCDLNLASSRCKDGEVFSSPSVFAARVSLTIFVTPVCSSMNSVVKYVQVASSSFSVLTDVIIAVFNGKADTDVNSLAIFISCVISKIVLARQLNFNSRFSIGSPMSTPLPNLVFNNEFKTDILFVIVLPVYLNCSISQAPLPFLATAMNAVGYFPTHSRLPIVPCNPQSSRPNHMTVRQLGPYLPSSIWF